MRSSTKPKIIISPDEENMLTGDDTFHHNVICKGHHHLSRAVQSFPVRMGDHAVSSSGDRRIYGSSIVGTEHVDDGGDDDDDDLESPTSSSPSRRRRHVNHLCQSQTESVPFLQSFGPALLTKTLFTNLVYRHSELHNKNRPLHILPCKITTTS